MNVWLCGQPATSGMGVADHTKDTFLELKRKKVHRYVIFRIDEKKRENVVKADMKLWFNIAFAALLKGITLSILTSCCLIIRHMMCCP
ncbi:CRIB domain-containing protein RIC7-like [Hibiscus syriacus]|uniref:CRIB domain-containing protein RIC7-like n=1 Tax=Hibiscus syriacus TaxID=106335 RepID=A0A6A3B0H3_HIBSY|nr:CRIB domain-containing protein RIC7-like [Hibiscus syriacus]